MQSSNHFLINYRSGSIFLFGFSDHFSLFCQPRPSSGPGGASCRRFSWWIDGDSAEAELVEQGEALGGGWRNGAVGGGPVPVGIEGPGVEEIAGVVSPKQWIVTSNRDHPAQDSLVQPEAEIPRGAAAIQADVADTVQEEPIADVITAGVIARFHGRSIPELCAMGGITLEEFSQSVAYKELFGQGLREGVWKGVWKAAKRVAKRDAWKASLSWPCAPCAPCASCGVVAARSLPLRCPPFAPFP
jgi:hypothetical protein